MYHLLAAEMTVMIQRIEKNNGLKYAPQPTPYFWGVLNSELHVDDARLCVCNWNNCN